ncbi:DUF2956 domain-containing protein [Vibrio sp.]|uniref:DUF2956 domain-containing protein n=1 Tax=Vibrio sp. TaxID=678 RepID=UPI003D13894D
MNKAVVPSVQTQQEAMKIAKATQKPGQTKEQTKLVSQGIEKGIALYKKQQKEKARLADKAKKKAIKQKQATNAEPSDVTPAAITSVPSQSRPSLLPWGLLVVSWAGFAAYLVLAG